MIGLRAAVVCCCLAGCDQVFMLEGPVPDAPPDAPCIPAATGDEDGDCHADLDDNCPGIAGPQADGDGDGVGDLCDPDPAVGGDRIFAFESFDDATATSRWRDPSTDTPWIVDDGVARHSSTTDTTALFQRTQPVPGTTVTIEAGFEFVAWAAGTPETTPPTTHLGVLVDGSTDLVAGHGCRIDPADGGEPSGVQLILGDATVQTQMSAVTPPAITQRIRIRLQRRTSPDELRCSLTVDDGPATDLVLARGAAVWPQDRLVGINAPGAAAALHHVTIYVAD